MKTVYFKKLDPRAIIPHYQTSGSSCVDLHILLDDPECIQPGELKVLRTGIAIELPRNTEGQVRPRSGLSIRYPNYIANSPGSIDCDYRGELKIIFVNNSKDLAIFEHGDRIAQLAIIEYICAEVIETTELSNTQRSTGGFGHTGL